MMRPSICIATARAFGARSSEAVRSAVAIELLHNAFLVHDDIEDESEMRRGEPALHSLHGVPLALNAGDAMLLLSLRPLLDNRRSLGPRLALDVLLETERMARESAEGQAMELGWRRDNVMELEDEDYFAMVLKKTSWLAVIYPMRVGAMIGTRGKADLDQFIRFGFLPRRGVPDPGRSSQSRRRPPLRQGGARRSLRGQAHADADPRVPARHSGGARQAEEGHGSASQRAAGR